MSSRQLLFFVLFLFYTCCLMAQDPSYHRLGESFFEDKDIYSILEDKDQNIWIGTDAGLVRYDGNEFKLLNNDDLKSQAVFNLLMDNEGQIFYYNFSGQIIEVMDDSLVLFFQVPEELASMGYSFHFDNHNNLVVYAKELIKVNPDKSITRIYTSDQFRPGGHITKREDGALLFLTGRDEFDLGIWINNELTRITYPKELLRAFKDPQPFSVHSQEIIMARKKEQILKKVGQNWERVPLSKNTAYCSSFLNGFFINENQLWLSCREKGAYVVDLDGNLLFKNKILEDYIISQVIQDKNGNIWVGTFKKGVLVIPTIKVIDFEKHPTFKEHEISCVEHGKKGILYVAVDNGTIYQIDSNNVVSILRENQMQDLLDLFYFKEDNTLYWDGGLLDLNNNRFRKVKKLIIKEITSINQNELMLATISGIRSFDKKAMYPLFNPRLQKYKDFVYVDSVQKILTLELNRSNTIHYDRLKKEMWVGTYENLFLFKENGAYVKIFHQGKPVSAKSIVQNKECVYVVVSDGILIIKEEQVVGKIGAQNGLLFNRITKLVSKDNYLYIATDKAFHRLNVLTDEVEIFSELDGFLNTTIFDFAVDDPYVWLATGRGLQRFDLDLLKQQNTAPKLIFSSIWVNDQSVDIKSQGVFDYDQNKINIEFIAQTYLEEAFYYEYRLNGTEDKWQRINANQHSVLYNALEAGNYSFEVKTVDIEGNHSPIISYAFSIAIPYWETWWFFLLCLLAVASIVALFFLIRIRVLKEQNQLLLEKKAMEKELVESRQTALRSQMNPHFLFNALNSIQEMIMVNEKNRAGQYLGKFADLMRMYLNQSRKRAIVLSEELEALKLYLDLEKVRFEESLTIQFEVGADLDIEAVSIPPMLIQPYVENAFKHGLLHKEEDRLLQISFNYQSTKNLVLCIIEDNGVGRIKSTEINRQRNIHHESFATSATQNRLDLLNYNKKNPIKVEIQDLKGTDNKASGTKVILQIPVNWEELVEDR